MTTQTSFVTPQIANETEIVIKKSRFIGRVVPIQSAAEAEATLADIRLVHKTANHNCYAWRVGLDVPIERFSDDGEPGGTAGRPILEVLRRQPVHNVLVVVTRYFGGTLLGANGLVRAYTEATADVLSHTPMLTCKRMVRTTVHCDYAQYGKFEYELNQLGLEMLDKQFADDVTFGLWLPEAEVATYLESFSNWSNGQVRCETAAPEYVGVAPDGSFVTGVWREDALPESE